MKPQWMLIADATRAHLLQQEPGVSATHHLDRTSIGQVEFDLRVAHESAH